MKTEFTIATVKDLEKVMKLMRENKVQELTVGNINLKVYQFEQEISGQTATKSTSSKANIEEDDLLLWSA